MDERLAERGAARHTAPMTPDAVIPTYDRVAADWAAGRSRQLYERRWLDRFLALAPGGRGRAVLDLGCGSGRPIAAYVEDRGARVTGVDAAPAMLDLFRANLPGAAAVEADMRGLDLGAGFAGILAWDSFFHLSADEQRAMFATFAAHALPRAALMFTSGHMAGEAIGEVAGEPIYHASLDPAEYRALLEANGFEVIDYRPEDPDCAGHTIWLARHTG